MAKGWHCQGTSAYHVESHSSWCNQINTDGSSLGNPGLAGYGVLLHDQSGNWVVGYNDPIGIATSLQAELSAIHYEFILALDRGYHKVICNSDSKLAENLILDVSSQHRRYQRYSVKHETVLVM
ncbi:hypothetical protein RJT34_03250 [Clitoria ternatea]|uniref:RNase H type-1 domain-containing protein n=1 Tax=Clitoria ternatea TaxID=43366 RepID=A0AAN9KLV8_CLITE